ncbi:MAG TPA: hypothetical protein VK590_06155 [Saprospiraceae bacterium]|nr:hypothetical protein [Saprospiraceae bacterium]
MHHSFDVELAQYLGNVDLAILVHHFQHWIAYNKRLKRNFKHGRTWTFQTREEIAAHFPYWSYDQVRRLTDKLVKKGILKKGRFNQRAIDKTIWYSFVDEEMFTIGRFARSTGESARSTGKSARAIPHSKPHSITTDSKDLGPETEAYQKNKEKTVDIQKRWKLTDDQFESFEWLKSKEVDAKDEKLAFWAKTYHLQRLIDVYNEAIHNKARSLKHYMGHLLDNKKQVHNSTIQANSDFAKDFAQKNNWRSLKIFKKYVKFNMGATWQELPLDMDSMQFINILMEKYGNSESK